MELKQNIFKKNMILLKNTKTGIVIVLIITPIQY